MSLTTGAVRLRAGCCQCAAARGRCPPPRSCVCWTWYEWTQLKIELNTVMLKNHRGQLSPDAFLDLFRWLFCCTILRSAALMLRLIRQMFSANKLLKSCCVLPAQLGMPDRKLAASCWRKWNILLLKSQNLRRLWQHKVNIGQKHWRWMYNYSTVCWRVAKISSGSKSIDAKIVQHESVDAAAFQHIDSVTSKTHVRVC